MPRQSVNINKFDRGFIDKVSDRDLIEGALPEVLNVDISTVGKIVPNGSFKEATNTLTAGNGDTVLSNTNLVQLNPGYGLFTFKSDVAPISGKTAGEHIVFTNGAGDIFINDSASSGSPTALIEFDSNADLTTDTSNNCNPVYYFADGGLRIVSNNFDDTAARKQSFIRQSRNSSNTMYNTTVGDNMHLFTSGLAAPVVGTFELFAPVTPDSESNGSATTNDIGLGIKADGSDGLWQPGNYAIGITYVYHNNQESLITNWTSNLNITEGQYPVVQISINDAVLDTATQEKFIQGMRVYLRNLTAGDEEYVLLIDVDFELGSRISLTDEFDAFNTSNTGYAITDDTRNDSSSGSGIMAYEVKQANIETYSTINGFSPNEHAIHFYNNDYKYKTATIANQRAFIGNVKYVDSNGKAKVMGDRIQYSPVVRYDTFPQSYFIDIGANDGDEIVKLLEFQDRLFVYKKNKLFIINIASTTEAGWYLEGEFMNRGIESPYAIVKSDIGVIWANQHGLFAFSQGIQKLSDNILDKTWSTHWSSTNALVGFIPKRNQVMIIKNASDMSKGGYIFDIQTKSFSRINHTSTLKTGGVVNSRPISNLIVLNNELCTFVDDSTNGTTNNQLIFFDVNNVDAVSQTVDIQTPVITGGLYSVDKHIYSIYVTYKNNGSALLLKAKYDSDVSFQNKFGTDNNKLDSSTLTTEEFVITSDNVINTKSIQLQISGTADASFELQDMTVVLRAKGVR